MKTSFAAAVAASAFVASMAAAAPAPAETPRETGSVFADLAALGYDLGKFRPGYPGRFPYR